MPSFASSVGRDHNPQGFTAWLAGGGLSHGATDAAIRTTPTAEVIKA
jgi:hypothetical protein